MAGYISDKASNMKKGIILAGVLFGCCLWTMAQQKIELQAHKPYHTEVRLCDYHKTYNDFLLNLPLTFSITGNNILIIMVGNDTILNYEQSVWMFSEEISFADFAKKNRNVKALKPFEKQNKTLSPILLSYKYLKLHRPFDDGYEVVKKNAKPIFFEIVNPQPNKPLTLSLQFYVAKPSNNPAYLFIAKCKPVEIEIVIR